MLRTAADSPWMGSPGFPRAVCCPQHKAQLTAAHYLAPGRWSFMHAHAVRTVPYRACVRTTYFTFAVTLLVAYCNWFLFGMHVCTACEEWWFAVAWRSLTAHGAMPADLVDLAVTHKGPLPWLPTKSCCGIDGWRAFRTCRGIWNVPVSMYFVVDPHEGVRALRSEVCLSRYRGESYRQSTWNGNRYPCMLMVQVRHLV